MPPDDLAGLCCQNPDCDSFNHRGEDNLLVIDHFGKAHHRLLYCRLCKARFSEFKVTPLFNSKLPHDKVLAVLEHLAEGCGVRQTARLVGVNKDTVTRLALLAGQHAQPTHDESVAFPPPPPARSSSMRNGRSWARSSTTATPTTPTTTPGRLLGPRRL